MSQHITSTYFERWRLRGETGSWPCGLSAVTGCCCVADCETGPCLTTGVVTWNVKSWWDRLLSHWQMVYWKLGKSNSSNNKASQLFLLFSEF